MLAPYPSDKREQATRNYELDRAISHTRQQQGRLKRLSVAVVVDDQVRLDAQGQPIHEPWSAEDLARFTRLVQDAVGFDASRGDSVSVINSRFSPVVEEDLDVPFYAQPWFWDIVKQLLGILFVLVLVFGVLRPVLQNLSGNPSRELTEGLDGEKLHHDTDEEGLGEDRISLTGPPNSIMLPSPSDSYEAQLNAIKGLVAEDPGRVALVVKQWINADD